MNIITSIDIFIAIIYFVIIIFVLSLIKSRNVNNYPEYKYFVKGAIAKLIGVLAFCLVYVFYYEGGDTINYYKGAVCILNLINYD